MSIYSDYINQKMSFTELTNERKRQLKRISEIRGRDVLVYASDIGKDAPNMIDYSDVLPFSDQLANIEGSAVDIILETPGGFAAVVEDLVRLVRNRFERVGIIVPGYAKSAGTIFAMAGDEILMGELSALGPIDAQILTNGKRYSADAFLKGFEKIRKEIASSGQLDKAYIPILQNISPGEIQHCENAQDFSKVLVTEWLKKYKFKFWKTHSMSGLEVTEKEKEDRAEEIAKTLREHSLWLTHERSIKIEDFKRMRLVIEDYSKCPDLNDAIVRYYTLLRMSFEANIYKIYETTTTQIYRSLATTQSPGAQLQKLPNPCQAQVLCSKCNATIELQVNFEKEFPIKEGSMPFPKDNILKCPICGMESDMSTLRQQLEAQTGKTIV